MRLKKQQLQLRKDIKGFYNDGKWKPAGDGYIAGVEFKQFRQNVMQQETVSDKNEEKGMDSTIYTYTETHTHSM